MAGRDPRSQVRSARHHLARRPLARLLVPVAGVVLSALDPAVAGSLGGVVALVTSNVGDIAVVGW